MIKISYLVDGEKEYFTNNAFANQHDAERFLLDAGIPAEDFRFITFEKVA